MDIRRYHALKDEVDKLLANDFIKESFYPSWLVNSMLVKKPNGKWRTYWISQTSTKLALKIASSFHITMNSRMQL